MQSGTWAGTGFKSATTFSPKDRAKDYVEKNASVPGLFQKICSKTAGLKVENPQGGATAAADRRLAGDWNEFKFTWDETVFRLHIWSN